MQHAFEKVSKNMQPGEIQKGNGASKDVLEKIVMFYFDCVGGDR